MRTFVLVLFALALPSAPASNPELPTPPNPSRLPFDLTSYELQGNGLTFKSADFHTPPAKNETEIPLENDVVRFAP
jgi:hypothetical protein